MICATLKPSEEARGVLMDAFSPMLLNFSIMPIDENKSKAILEKKAKDITTDDIAEFSLSCLYQVYSKILPYKKEYLRYLDGLRLKYGVSQPFFLWLSFLFKGEETPEKEEVGEPLVFDYTLKEDTETGLLPSIPIDEEFFDLVGASTSQTDTHKKISHLAKYGDFFMTVWDFIACREMILEYKNEDGSCKYFSLTHDEFYSDYLSSGERAFV